MAKEKKKVPALRFKAFTNDWEQRKVSEITIFHKQGFYTTEDYGDNKKYYLLRGTDLSNNKLSLINTPKINASEKEYKSFKVEIGDFLIVRSGNVGTYGIVYKKIPAIFGSYLIDFRFNQDKIKNEFFGFFYQSDQFKNQLLRITQQSANTNINAENIKSTLINLPSKDEQEMISLFLQQIDSLIALHQRKLVLLKQLKKGLLQKMFADKNSKQPVLRFKGFHDDWEQRKLGDVANIETGKLDANAMVESGKYDFYTSGIKKYHIDVPAFEGPAITIAGNGATVGYMHLADGKFNAYQRTYVLTKFLNDRYFLFNEIGNKLPRKIQQESRTGNIPYIVLNMLTELDLVIPSEKEQKKIGNFFNNLDTLITLHQRKQNHLKLLKKSLLQQMFM